MTDRLHLNYGFGNGFLELTITVPVSPQEKERLKQVVTAAIDLALESLEPPIKPNPSGECE